MARKARIKALYSTYFVEQRCRHTQIFECDDEKKTFIKCLKSAQQQYGFLLLAYCLTNDRYQLVLYDNGNDITKIMRTINIEYALKVDRKDFKLTERFKSEILHTNEELIEKAKSMHCKDNCNPFNSYSGYCDNKNKLIDDTIMMAIFGNNRETYTAFIKDQLSLVGDKVLGDPVDISCEKNCIKTLSEGKSRLEELLNAYHLDYEELLADKKKRNDLIVHFRKASVLSLKEIGELFGGISESAISKIIKRMTSDD
ncbi:MULTISPECIES: hypothetical protein [unclassified Fusibacter]|uniref:hypothetical protein n=1 Tax=unclassified Fusibacter TaxID=2624464 RepID=UPI001011E3EF|nr:MULTISPECIES: hypothetical protein [unclassified Fusibacter]MCK8059374.1 hypothetical protein [Fusibacter sp. A2]NPE21162.1 hypothetical protein [Fusibacter sp. A1]